MSNDALKLFSRPTAGWFNDTFGAPTRVQEEAWAAIAQGSPVLVSAPTGTGKTLSAFLIFIDRLNALAAEAKLAEELYLIYVSPLKSLAGDIRENLRRPLDGIPREEGAEEIRVAIRTGDTPQKERQRMIKHPPHILITTPESLYLMLTSKGGRTILKTARAVILDELHALIDTKRGAHLMFSVARLDRLCGHNLQRIGLSATIEPLELAAAYLSPEPAVITAPHMEKRVRIDVVGTLPFGERRKDPIWEELAELVYERCLSCRTVIAFCEGRRYAEKLAYYVNLLGGEEFARVHHGSLSKEQRDEAEQALRAGTLRLLCATSSMELGIDVGEIDQVLQIGCPRTISGTMQRLGRAGHNPGRESVMVMYPRTAPESLYCGITAKIAAAGGVEWARPPRLCLDVLAQHLVSMAAGEGYSVGDVMEITARAYPFREVTGEDVVSVLRMLAGDYEHDREIPVRPRLLYDRIHGWVSGDVYSRMLAVAAGGTIPDKGLYTAKTEDGVKLGELDEEFVYESQIGDRFLLGAFAWKIVRQDRDTVYVEQAPVEGARVPFWKGEIGGRTLKTSQEFGKILRELEQAAAEEEEPGSGGEPEDDGEPGNGEEPVNGEEPISSGEPVNGVKTVSGGDAADGFRSDQEADGRLKEELARLGLDGTAVSSASGFLRRQLLATGGLPSDRTVIVEHFTDHTGSHQVMVHAMFGKRVNAPLALLVRYAAESESGCSLGCVDDETGFLLYPYGDETLPEGLLYRVEPERARAVLGAILTQTPLFNMTFRYNAAKALMMGMRNRGRQPLWMQRLRSTEMMSSLVQEPDHPLIRETRRECLEDQWDIDGVIWVLDAIRSGQIAVREVCTDVPSPMSLPFQWQVEAEEMYEYSPTTPGIRQAVSEALKQAELLKPSAEALSGQQVRRKLPEDEEQLHTLLMIEGDLTAGELDVPVEWLERLAGRGLACYVEPGLWIAAEQEEEYRTALPSPETGETSPGPDVRETPLETPPSPDARETPLETPSSPTPPASGQPRLSAAAHIVRRMLYYRGGRTAGEIRQRYCFSGPLTERLLAELLDTGGIVEDGGVYYHAKLYDRARQAAIRSRRLQTVTRPGRSYVALLAGRVWFQAPPEEQLRRAVEQYCGTVFPVRFWEELIFSRRVNHYGEAMLDRLLAQGDYFWKMTPEGGLCFLRCGDIDWEAPLPEPVESLSEDERLVYGELKRRGASFLRALTEIPQEETAQAVLLKLAAKGLVCADSFVPVRQWQNREKIEKAAPRQRVNARVMALSAGRWDLVRAVKVRSREELLLSYLDENLILCRETFKKSAADRFAAQSAERGSFREALDILRVWEYTGRVRRGYFVEGMSGAQFIRSEIYEGVTASLGREEDTAVWLNAADPAQIWGKLFAPPQGREFLNLPGTAVALRGGLPAAVLERQGKVLRVFDPEALEPLLREFVREFREKRLFPGQKRLILKEYPPEAEGALKSAGFLREMRDYVLYR